MSLKRYIIDIDGTLLFNGVGVSGASEFVRQLQNSHTEFLLATNSVKTPSLQISRLANAAIEVTENQIYSPVDSINQHILQNNFTRTFTVGSKDEIDQITSEQENTNPQLIILLDFEKENFSYNYLQKVVDHIENGCPVITASSSPFYYNNNKKTIDTGAFVALIESVTKKEIPVFGKPSLNYFKNALEKFEKSVAESWMIGDDWQTDIVGAKNAGLKTILVKTGKYQIGDELNSSPDKVVTSLIDIL